MDNVFIEPRLDSINDNPNRKLFSIGNKKYLASMIRLASYNDLYISPVISGDVFYSTILYKVHPNEISKEVSIKLSKPKLLYVNGANWFMPVDPNSFTLKKKLRNFLLILGNSLSGGGSVPAAIVVIMPLTFMTMAASILMDSTLIVVLEVSVL